MSELCADCYNKITRSNDAKKKFIMTRAPELCEECGKWKPVIIRVRTRYRLREWCEELAENIFHMRERI